MTEKNNIMEKINENKYVKQTKQSIIKLAFSRAGVFAFLVILQIALVIYFYRYLNIDPSVLLGGDAVITFILMLIIMNNDKIKSSYKLSWFMLIALVPIFGAVVFALHYFSIGYRKEHRRVMQMEKDSRAYHNRDMDLIDQLYKNDLSTYNAQNYFYDLGGFVVHRHTATKYYSVGEDIFADILKAIQRAEKFIFIEIFILSYGYMWGTVLEELVKKVEAGVEVRLLIDGTNLLTRVKPNFVEEMESLGIKCKVFSPMYPVVSTHSNNRDHRKIFVIDNEIAFTGGINLADEYINVFERFGHWKDCGLRLEGRAAEGFTIMFLQMWNTRTDRVEDFSKYLIHCPNYEGEGLVLPFSDTPMDDENYGISSLIMMLNNAKRYVYIMTPYLIVEDEVINAITMASKKGVDVRICLPHIPDKKVAFALARTHYRTLLEAGVRIYEYTPGFVHSKTWLSDDSYGFVGTINLDYRAFYLNFECGVWMKDTAALIEMKNDFEVFFSIGTHVTLETIDKLPISQKIIGQLAKPFAPLF